MTRPKAPVLIDLDGLSAKEKSKNATITPATVAPVADAELPGSNSSMQVAVGLAARPSSALLRWFWRLLGALVSFGVSLWLWDFVSVLMARNPVLGYAAFALVGLFALVCGAMILRELAAISRLRKLDVIHRAADQAFASGDLPAARKVSDQLVALYAARDELDWARARLLERRDDAFDADAVLGLAETELLAPLDAAAQLEIQAAARQVATITAIVPLAFADVAVALTANVRMIRRIAEIYGGRAGVFGSWRLTRSVMTHLVATGAVAVGDDLISSVAGGNVLAKVSRRFGEGMINGALTARVGVAAMDVCRPMPFRQLTRPSVTGLVRRALVGLFAFK